MHFVRALLLAAAFSTCSGVPNVLMISSDSMDGRVLDGRQHIGKSVAMPALRALAARGSNFVDAYSHSPVCGPSRAAALTSRYIHDIGTWSNYQEIADAGKGVDPSCVKFYGLAQCEAWAKEYPVSLTLLDAFSNAGYDMAVFGKIDVGAGLAQRYNDTGNESADHTGPEMRTVPRGAGLLRNSMAWSGWSSVTNDKNPFADDNATSARVIAWLHERQAAVGAAEMAGAPPPPPFFAYMGLNIPHEPFTTNARWLAQVDASTIHPPWAPENASSYHPYDWHMSVSKGCTEPISHADIMQLRAVYLAMCAQADAFHGEVIDALGALAEDTIVLFWSDHGEMAFEARQVLKDSFREPSSRVPLIFAGPGVAVGRVIEGPVSLLDIWPTLSVLTGIAPPPGARGYSLVPQMAEGVTPTRGDHPGAVVGEFYAENSNTGSFMLRAGDLKLISYGHTFPWFDQGYDSQLFNVSADPLEMTDLGPSRPDIVAAMEEQLSSLLGTPFEELDALVKANDQLIWRAYLTRNMTDAAVRKECEGTYKGFDDADWARIQTWLSTTPSPRPSPSASAAAQ